MAASCALLVFPEPARGAKEQFTTDFRIEHCDFSDRGRNAYFSVEPGDQLVLAGEENGETVEVVITVLNETRRVVFETERGESLDVRTRVVEERESVDGELAEVSRNFFSRCQQTDEVYYFGEEVDIYEGGEIVSHTGAWLAGENGAQPGLIMPATYLLGSRYFQEIAPDVALDRAEHTASGFEITVEAGTFSDCVEVTETTPLEPGKKSVKVYCPGVGLTVDDVVELVQFDVTEE
jgi:hypothetical protein